MDNLTTRIKYQNLADLSDFLSRRLEYKTLTLELTELDYARFVFDIDTKNNIYVNKFRPIETKNNDICEWSYNGMLKFKIKLI